MIFAGTALAGDLNIQSGGTLKGSGTVSGGTLNLLSGGSLAPGDSPGCIASGDLSLASGGALELEIEGTSACTEHDQLSVTGSVSLGSATLNIDASAYSLNLGDTFTIIDNDGSDSVSGTFNGLSEGGEVDQGSYILAISYVGGDGNDVTLTAFYGQSITFGAIADREYGDTLSLSASASSGLPVSYSSSTTGVCNVDGSELSFKGLGTCTVTAYQPGNGSYNAAESVTHTFSVLKASQSISFASIADKDYGDADFSVSVSSGSGLSVSLVSNTPSVCSLSGSSVSLLDTGTCSLTASQDGNYFYYAASGVTRTFAVNSVDSDGDEVEDADDAFPDDPAESVDTDGDGTGDNADKDDDNDGVLDTDDAFPNDPSEDTDSDGDDVGDNSDAFPDDDSETVDSDGDGIGDNADTDDDNDGVLDTDDAFPFDPSEDTDSDGDEVGDNSDAFPNDPSESADTDADGIGDNGDVDSDGDGLIEIGSVDDLYYINNNLAGTAYNDGSGDNSSGCGDGVSVTACSGYELVNDIDFDTDGDGDIVDEAYFNDNAGWQPIGESFTGTLDGNGYSILNLYINRVDEDYVGLFSKVQSATFRDLSISGSVSGDDYVGLLFGRNPLNNSYQVNVSDIEASGAVSGNDYVGAIAGYAYLTRNGNTGLWSDAEVVSTGSHVGGLLGSVSSSYSPFIISYAEFVGTVTGVDDVGGVIGWSPFVELNDSYADASVTGSGSNVGGLVGRGRFLTIENSFALGSVSGIENVGGLAGLIDSSDPEEIVDSFAANSVSGDQYVGGLVGYVDTASYSMTLQRVYAAGAVSGSSDSGGLVGYSASSLSVTEAYWDTETTGQSSTYSDKGTGLTTAELQCPIEPGDTSCSTSVYSTWNTAEWDFGTDTQYPALIIDDVTYRDSDGDGVWDTLDAFPDDATESADSDGDDVGDNSDAFPDDDSETVDSDGDGVGDNSDAFPNDPSESADGDGDDVGDNADAYPNDPNESADSDGDGVGDNADAFPSDPDESADTDGDGTGDNSDPDIDNDGAANADDAFPYDDSESVDSDGDGTGNNADVDVDGDGLIEIGSLAELDNIRNNLAGSAYNDGSGDDSSGCGDNSAVFVCSGYELTAGLDFDTNGDGTVDASDDYWNGGEGWQPLGSSAEPFAAVFQGNGFRIHNLVIDRSGTDDVGLFGYMDSAAIYDLGLVGEQMRISGNQYVGALAGRAYNVIISGSYATGPVSASGGFAGGLIGYGETGSITASYAGGKVSGGDASGGLAGTIDNVQLSASYAAGDVSGGVAVGGLVGYARNGTAIEASYAAGSVVGDSALGGLVGNLDSSSVSYGHWGTDSTGLDSLYGATSAATETGNAGVTLAELRCPTAADDNACSAYILYGNWGAYVDGDDNAYWDFGTGEQLPALILDSVVYRDFDSDGSFDFEDSDDDNDGVDDGSDTFPYDAAETTDADGDGTGDNADTDDDNDSWSDADEATCGSDGLDSGSVPADNDADAVCDVSDTDDDNDGVEDGSDAFPYDASESADNDGDGTGDNADTDDDNDGVEDGSDAFPFDAAESTDTDGDGTGDNADTDDDNDGVEDGSDAFPYDASESADFDGDGTGDNADTDDDNDGVEDTADVFPYDATGSSSDDDIDQDDDGLIEIRTLADLDAVRDDLAGTSLSGVTAGCPDSLCAGYELVADLDFDENGDGLANDTYNSGAGWVPIGATGAAFATVFDGNGHRIDNLVISGASASSGLFGAGEDMELRNLHLSGSISASADNVGGLIGLAKGGSITNVSFSGDITDSSGSASNYGGLVGSGSALALSDCYALVEIAGGFSAGGVAGALDGSAINRCFSTGSVDSSQSSVGGLVGEFGGTLANTFSTASVSGASNVGGLVGSATDAAGTLDNSYATGRVTASGVAYGGLVGLDLGSTSDSYWDTASSAQSTSSGGTGYDTAILQAPTASTGIYAAWSTDDWDFGSDSQYPALLIDGTAYRDNDGDGTLDASDAFPEDATEDSDSDGDGTGDNADAFPDDDTETVDTDGDGTGDNADTDDDNDSWSDADEATCGSDALDSGSVPADNDADAVCDVSDTDDDNDGVEDGSDAFPYDASESADNDGDGTGDNADSDDDNDGVDDGSDAFPYDASESADFDGDGTGDNADSDDDNDGVEDSADAFPYDASESADFDGDGIGDNADTDDDNDGVEDALDAFPYNPAESVDTDGDGTGNNADTDDDNDGVEDGNDAFPYDDSESADFDGDGTGDNADLDDDNDGVEDTADAFPYDSSESADSDGDGTGDNSDPTPNGDDADSDGDGMPDAYEVEHGLGIDDPSDADGDLDGDGRSNLDEYLAGSDINADDVAPVLTLPADIEVVSTGATTAVDLGTASAMDAKDGDLVPVADESGPFVPGRHIVTWSATDAAGNSATDTQIVDVVPLVTVAETQTVAESSDVSVEVGLNGSPVSYPVTVPYTVSGTATADDHDLLDGSVEIESGLTASIDFATVADSVFEGDETIVVTLGEATNASLGNSAEQVITITEDNVAPSVSVTLYQNGEPVASVYADAGEATVQVEVSDVNPDDSFTVSWSSSVLAPLNGYSEETFVFDPSGLSGAFEVNATVTDTGGETASAGLLLRIDSETPDLSESADSDGDATSDADEGLVDSDGDRIPDYLDADTGSNLLPANGLGAYIQSEAGTALVLGDSAYTAGYGISLVSLVDIENRFGENLASLSSYLFLHGIFDFEVRGVAAGSSTRVVLPLTAAILADARYVKYKRAIGWVDFAEDAANSVASAAGELGVCPEPGSDAYQPGLAEGHFCVQLTIEDGGPNDADGEANGTVVDPSAVGTLSVAAPVISASAESLEQTSFAEGDGEKVVFAFTLESDSTDAELSALTLQAIGDLDETADIGEVNLYLDENGNGVAEASERIGTGSYAADNGSLEFTLDEAYQLSVGESSFLVTYQF